MPNRSITVTLAPVITAWIQSQKYLEKIAKKMITKTNANNPSTREIVKTTGFMVINSWAKGVEQTVFIEKGGFYLARVAFMISPPM